MVEKLLSLGASATLCDRSGMNSLAHAWLAGYSSRICQLLIEHRAETTLTKESMSRTFVQALRRGSFSTANMLLEQKDIDPNFIEMNGTAAHAVISYPLMTEDEKIAYLQHLKDKGANLSLYTPGFHTPLWEAMHFGLDKIALWLFDQGVPLLPTEAEDILACAIVHDKSALIHLLLERGLLPTTTILSIALVHSKRTLIAELIKRCPDINIPVDDITPLMCACFYGDYAAASALIAKGAALACTRKTTLLHLVLFEFKTFFSSIRSKEISSLVPILSKKECGSIEEKIALLKLLIELDGTAINMRDAGDLTPLGFAILENAPAEIIDLLLAAGANPSMLDTERLSIAMEISPPTSA